MFPASFDYYRAASVEDAVALLGRHADAKVIAGGHSLLPLMKLRLSQPGALIDVGRIAALAGITREGESIRVGATTCHAAIAASPVLRADCPLLAEAAAKIGDPAVRNKGTIGGNIAHADPASDLPAVLVALGAVIEVTGPRGARRIPAADFFVGLLTTAAGHDELITAVHVPVLGPRTGTAYVKAEHPASGYAVCGAAAIVRLAADGTCDHLCLCFNGVAATPVRADAALAALIGTRLEGQAIDVVIARELTIAEALGDIHASAAYRIQLARVYGCRAIKFAGERARA